MHYIIKFSIIIKIFFLRSLSNKLSLFFNKENLQWFLLFIWNDLIKKSIGKKIRMLNLSTNEHPVIFFGKLKKVGQLIWTGILINSSTICQEIAMSITDQIRANP